MHFCIEMKKQQPAILNDQNTKNSHGFYVLTSGINLERFLKNPVCLKDHSNLTKDVLGTWTGLKTENDVLLGTPKFDTQDPEGLEVVRKVLSGTIKGTSLGLGLGMTKPNFKVIDGKLTLVSSELKEISIVPVGSNGNTIILYDEKDEILTDEAIKELCLSAQKTQNPNRNPMKILLTHLQLSDEASETAVLAAIKEIEKNLADAKADALSYKSKLDALNAEKETALKAAFVIELADAQKDGRIDAAVAPSFEKLAETNLADTLATLKKLPIRKSVESNLSDDDKDEVAELLKLTWSELDKKGLAGKLRTLDLNAYKKVYKKEFGKDLPE